MRHANASLAFGLAAFGSLAVAGPALAQAPASGPGSSRQAIQHGVVRGSATPAGTPGTAPGMSANQQEMVAATGRMTRDMMDAPITGDPVRDLVAMMVPHHQGAVDMARIYLRDGTDPAIRQKAQEIIVGQEREIAELRSWLTQHPASGHWLAGHPRPDR